MLITGQLLPGMAATVVDAIVVNWTVVALYASPHPLGPGGDENRQPRRPLGLAGHLRVPIKAIS